MFQFVEIGGKRYSHLIDPQTGLGLTRPVSVTVIAPTGLESDGLDSAAAILGPERGLKLLEGAPNVEGRIVTMTPAGIKTFKTRGFEKYVAPAGQSMRPAAK